MIDQEFVIIDVETTGLSPLSGDRIVEVAALKVKGLKPVSQFYSLVNPEREISWGAYQVNGISQEMVATAPVARQVLPQFVKFVGRAHLVGHNIKFDLGFLMNEFSLLDLDFSDEIKTHDTMLMARSILPELRSYSLANVARALNIVAIQQHRAMADVHLTFEVFRRLIAKKSIQPSPSAPRSNL